MRRVFLPLAMLMLTLTFSCLIGCGDPGPTTVDPEITIEEADAEMEAGAAAVREAMNK